MTTPCFSAFLTKVNDEVECEVGKKSKSVWLRKHICVCVCVHVCTGARTGKDRSTSKA